MITLPPLRLPVTERSQAAEARRTAVEFARNLSFTETGIGEIAIAVTEAGNNLANHAREGEILLAAVPCGDGAGLEMLSIDRGPGMDVERCLPDGFSTYGTSGTGLGAIRRMAKAFDVWSTETGTILFARFESRHAQLPAYSIGQVLVSKPGENVCGDAWGARTTPEGLSVAVCDGLGHGLLAAEASQEGVRAFCGSPWAGATNAVADLHAALRASRGAAIAVAAIDAEQERLEYCGLGNIAGTILHPDGIQRMVSHNGTAGHSAAKIASFRYKWRPGSVLVMHSDGIVTHWSFDRYPGLLKHHPSVIAAVLYRDFSRGRDDVAAVVVKQDPR